jgi:hypothetical protein
VHDVSQYEEAILAMRRCADAIEETIQAVRAVDKLLPSQVRSFNGEMDDLCGDFAKLQPCRERLLQRTQGAGTPDLAIPDNAGALADGLRA